MPRSSHLRSLALALLCASLLRAKPIERNADQAELNRLAGPAARALLLYFVASDCPISNRYFPEMMRIAAEFAPDHVSAAYVYPNGGTPSIIGEHQQLFGAAEASVSLDPYGLLTRMTKATATPEAALLVRVDGKWQVKYVGRLDNRYLHFGVERTRTTEHDLERAVRAALQGRPVPPSGGPPVGCAIVTRPMMVGRTTPKAPRVAGAKE